MTSMVDAFFEIGREEPEESDESGNGERVKGEKPREGE